MNANNHTNVNSTRPDQVARLQRTLTRSFSVRGHGIHGGAPARVTLRPAGPETGIVFRRVDLPDGNDLVARWDRVVATQLSTVLANERGIAVATVEHLLAALRGCEVDNALIEIHGGEVPILDGSSQPWVRRIRRVGTVAQPVPRRVIRVLKPVQVTDDDRWLRVVPAPQSRWSVEIDFDHPAIGTQSLDWDGRDFAQVIAPARTFGFLRDIHALHRQGLALGASLATGVVLDDQRVANPEGLRFADEFVRHKLLDCYGDLYLAGAPILGQVVGRKIGHQLNNRLLRALFADPTAWRLEHAEETKPALAA